MFAGNVALLLFWWGQGKLECFVGGRFEKRIFNSKMELRKKIEGTIVEIRATPYDTWRIIISGTLQPVQKVDVREYARIAFDRGGRLHFTQHFALWSRERSHRVLHEITFYPLRKKRGPQCPR